MLIGAAFVNALVALVLYLTLYLEAGGGNPTINVFVFCVKLKVELVQANKSLGGLKGTGSPLEIVTHYGV